VVRFLLTAPVGGASRFVVPVAVTTAVAALAVVGCAAQSGSSTRANTPSGVVSGTVRTYGGVDIGGSPAANGTPRVGVVVSFELDGHPAGSVTTGASGQFTVRLPVGTYGVDACGFGRSTGSVTVKASVTTAADFGCQVP